MWVRKDGLGSGPERSMEETAQRNGGKDVAGSLEDSGVCTEETSPYHQPRPGR